MRTTLRELLDEATSGPWAALYGTVDNPRAEPGAVLIQEACHESYWRDYCFVSDANTGRSFDDARLMALAPTMAEAILYTKDALAPLVPKIEFALHDGTPEQMRADLEYLHKFIGDAVAYLRAVGE